MMERFFPLASQCKEKSLGALLTATIVFIILAWIGSGVCSLFSFIFPFLRFFFRFIGIVIDAYCSLGIIVCLCKTFGIHI